MLSIRAIRGFSIVATNLILARLLFPKDFGLASIAISITTIISQLSDFGLGKAVIQKGTLDENILSTGATLRLIVSIISCILLFFSAPLFNYMYKESEIVNIIRICSIIFIIQSAGFIPTSIINIKLEFKHFLIPTFGSNLAMLFSAILFALLKFGYWSIILSNIIGAIVNVLLLWILFPWKISYKIQWNIGKQLLNYGKYATIISILSAFVVNADRFISAIFLSIIAVGYYAVAYTWGTFIVFNMSYIVAGVTFPSFSVYKNNISLLRNSFLNGIKYLYLITIPIIALLIVFSKEFIIIFLGNIWIPSLQVFQLLLIYSLFYILYFIHSDLFFALNEQKILLKIHIVMMFVLIVFIYPLGYLYNIVGIALTLIISFSIGSILNLFYSSQFLKYTLTEFVSIVSPQFSSGILVGLFLLFIKPFVEKSYLFIGLAILLSMIIYIVLIKLMSNREYWNDIIKTYKSTIQIFIK